MLQGKGHVGRISQQLLRSHCESRVLYLHVFCHCQAPHFRQAAAASESKKKRRVRVRISEKKEVRWKAEISSPQGGDQYLYEQMTAYFHGNTLVSSEMSGGDSKQACVNKYMAVYWAAMPTWSHEPKHFRPERDRSHRGDLLCFIVRMLVLLRKARFINSQCKIKCWTFHLAYF